MTQTTPREGNQPVATDNETLMLPIPGSGERAALASATPPVPGDGKAAEATIFRPLPLDLVPEKAEAKGPAGEGFDPLEHMVLKPRRGKRPKAGTPAYPAQVDTPRAEPMAVPVFNALEGAAAQLLALVPQVRASVRGPDPRVLRERLIEALDAFEAKVKGAGYEATTRSSASFALCALLDEAVLSTPWGRASGWAQQPLLQTRHRSQRGVQGFFELLRVAEQNPGANLDLLELMYLCLCFGFFNQPDQAQTRETLYRTIKTQRGGSESIPEAPGQRQTGAPPAAPLWQKIPPWGLTGASAVLIGGLFMVLSFLLHQDLERVTALLDGAARVLEPVSSRVGKPGSMPSTVGVDKPSSRGRAVSP